MPEVTIMLVVFDSDMPYLKETVDSILRQSFTDFELLIMDNSAGNLADVIRGCSDCRIRLEKRISGFGGAMNEGILLALGTYIMPMEPGHILHPERLRIQMKRMNRNMQIAVCGTWMRGFRKDQPSFLLKGPGPEIFDPLPLLLKGNIIFHFSAMFRKKFLTDHGIVYKDYPQAEDYRLWMDIACAGGLFYCEPQPLTFYRISADLTKGKTPEEQNVQLMRIRQEIIEFLIDRIGDVNLRKTLCLNYQSLTSLYERQLIGADSLCRLFYEIWANLIRFHSDALIPSSSAAMNI